MTGGGLKYVFSLDEIRIEKARVAAFSAQPKGMANRRRTIPLLRCAPQKAATHFKLSTCGLRAHPTGFGAFAGMTSCVKGMIMLSWWGKPHPTF